ncbi:MAG: site-specific integrase [Alphaproteobacteria bacterium]|nr:MAG: site-specific integrase [Alphaproteobacteria bacterium]
MGVVCQNGIFHVRRRVPADLKVALGKGEIWRSLQTDSARNAARRFPGVAAMIEEEFERARPSLSLTCDSTLIRPSRDGSPSILLADIVRGVVEQLESRAGGQAEPVVSKTIAEVYDAYLADPRQSWCPRTAQSYETTKRWVIDVFGAETPIRAITRESCREFVQLLLHMPRFAYKRFPGVPIPKVIEMTLGRDDIPRISVANVNAYLIRFCCVMNWAEQEGFIERSPAKGLRVPDPVRKRDKRKSFSLEQLQRIFAAPIYTGCEDDWLGYNKPGPNRPRRARFWIALIGLFSGMRLNEICQCDTADIVEPDGVPCFRIVTGIDEEDQHKRLKTAASERLVPIHRELLDMGFMAYVADRRRAGDAKLFPELPLNYMGYRSVTFSRWFSRFLDQAGTAAPRTSYHSLRHCFRDALRENEVPREIGMILGGWTATSASVADNYGSGFRPASLAEAINKVSYPGLDLGHLKRT